MRENAKAPPAPCPAHGRQAEDETAVLRRRLTGRYAPEPLIELADTVTEMKAVKHAFKEQDIKAQKGIEL
jgi:ATP:corrinoid adenosyltransferase